MVIEPQVLPDTALVDTQVLILALGDRPKDPRSLICKAFLRAMQDNGKQILIAAPTLAEVLRGGSPKKSVPKAKGICVVPFDERAAEILGTKFPKETFRQEKADTGLSLNFIKYDALIVACAIRHDAKCMITLDRGMTNFAKRVELSTAKPEDFETRQTELDLKDPNEPSVDEEAPPEEGAESDEG